MVSGRLRTSIVTYIRLKQTDLKTSHSSGFSWWTNIGAVTVHIETEWPANLSQFKSKKTSHKLFCSRLVTIYFIIKQTDQQTGSCSCTPRGGSVRHCGDPGRCSPDLPWCTASQPHDIWGRNKTYNLSTYNSVCTAAPWGYCGFVRFTTFCVNQTPSDKSVLHFQWIVPHIFKLLPKRHIFFDLVIRFITNRKYAFFCIF